MRVHRGDETSAVESLMILTDRTFAVDSIVRPCGQQLVMLSGNRVNDTTYAGQIFP